MVLIAGNKGLPISERRYSFEEYLKREEKSARKNEFYDGLIIPMAGAKARHNEIAMNTGFALKMATRNLPNKYRVYNSDQKIRIESANATVYPDAVVISEEPQFWKGREDLITNPLVVVEVLSKSTSHYDLGEKFILYQRIPSFEEFITIEQDTICVESWYKIAENTWQKTTYTDLNSEISLRSLGISIALSDIYHNIEF